MAANRRTLLRHCLDTIAVPTQGWTDLTEIRLRDQTWCREQLTTSPRDKPDNAVRQGLKALHITSHASDDKQVRCRKLSR